MTFLDTIREKQLEEERERQMRDKEEVKNFREHVIIAFNSTDVSNLIFTERLLPERMKSLNHPFLCLARQNQRHLF